MVLHSAIVDLGPSVNPTLYENYRQPCENLNALGRELGGPRVRGVQVAALIVCFVAMPRKRKPVTPFVTSLLYSHHGFAANSCLSLCAIVVVYGEYKPE